MSTSERRTAAELLVGQLQVQGADLAFGVPGESYLAVLDALRGTGLRFVTCRQEGGAGYAAEAHAKLTGRPGVLMVTRGPGATNAAVAVHTAQQDDTPLIVLVGMVPSTNRGRDAFQEIDLVRAFGGMTKSVEVLDSAGRAPELIARAWSTAAAGRPGPVVVGLPEDVLEQRSDAPLLEPAPPSRNSVADADVAAVRELLDASQRPLVVAGGGGWSDADVALLPTAFPGVPLATAFRRQDLVDHRSRVHAGPLGLGADPALVARVRDSDLVVVVGDRLDDPSSEGFELFGPGRGFRFVHVHPDPREIGRVHRPDLGLVCSPAAFVAALDARPVEPRSEWAPWTDAVNADAVSWAAGGGTEEAVARSLRELLRDDAVVTHGAGNFTRPLQRAYRYHRPGRQLAPVSGSMGYGLPAALAAAVTYPERQVVCVAGDGDLLMTAQELATVAHVGASATVLVVNNAAYGTIRTHQERRYPGREIATGLTNPDFVRLAEAFGGIGTRATTVDEAVAALGRGVSGTGLHLVELVV